MGHVAPASSAKAASRIGSRVNAPSRKTGACRPARNTMEPMSSTNERHTRASINDNVGQELLLCIVEAVRPVDDAPDEVGDRQGQHKGREGHHARAALGPSYAGTARPARSSERPARRVSCEERPSSGTGATSRADTRAQTSRRTVVVPPAGHARRASRRYSRGKILADPRGPAGSKKSLPLRWSSAPAASSRRRCCTWRRRVGTIGVVDDDVDESNLQRQVARDGRGRHAEGGVGAAAPRRHQPAREITNARGAAERGECARRARAVRHRRRRRLRQLCRTRCLVNDARCWASLWCTRRCRSSRSISLSNHPPGVGPVPRPLSSPPPPGRRGVVRRGRRARRAPGRLGRPRRSRRSRCYWARARRCRGGCCSTTRCG